MAASSAGSRVARIAVPVAIPVALAVVVGVIVAVTDGYDTHVNNAALANCASPAASASAAAGDSAAVGGAVPERTVGRGAAASPSVTAARR